MHDSRRHRNDDPAYCWFCKNFRLVPIQEEGTGVFRCESKNSPAEVKTCFNYDPRELPDTPFQSFEVQSCRHVNDISGLDDID